MRQQRPSYGISSTSRILRVSSLLLVLLCLTTASRPLAGEDAEMRDLFDRFYEVGLDASRSAAVENVTIQRDGLTITLQSGRLWFAEPIAGRVTGAQFVGEGRLVLQANGLVGRNMLRATLSNKNSGVPFPGKLPQEMIHRPAPGEKDFDRFEASFNELFLRFDDGLEQELAALMADSTVDAGAADDSFRKRNREVYEMRSGGVEKDFILHVIDGLDRFPFFLAEFRIGPVWLSYFAASSSQQETWVGTHPPLGAGSEQRVLTWTAFDRAEDYDPQGRWNADLILDHKPLIDVSKVEMKINLPSTLSFTIDAKLTFTPLADELGVVWFDLINNYGYNWWEQGGRPVTVKSIQDAAGNELGFLHVRDRLLVRLQEPAKPGSEVNLRFQAEEKIIQQLSEYSWSIVDDYPWFPQHGYQGGRYAIDWTIQVKSPRTAIASGRLVESREEGGDQITRWVTDREVLYPGFIFGRFASREETYKSSTTGREVVVGVHAQPLGRFRGTGKMKAVGKQAQDILKLYEEFFGPYPYDRLDIAQMAPIDGFSEAPPGLLYLTSDAFVPAAVVEEVTRDDPRHGSYYHDLFGQQMALQWFGHDVVCGRDEDRWLRVALAEYASAIYVEQIDGAGKFQEKLKEWHDYAKVGERSGFPVAAGMWAAANSVELATDYRRDLLLNKGAYLIHMIRSMVGPDKFLAGIQSFLENHRGGPVSTAMFQADLEEAAGIPLDWFFDQWLYTPGIPTLHFSYTTQRSDDGTLLLSGQIVQDEENWKQLVIPVYYDLGGKQPSVQRQAVGSTDFTFKAKLPGEPRRVWLDEERTVLADIVASK